MKSKLEMAHEYALVRLTCDNPKTLDEIIKLSWYYADAMQAEADKRKPSGLPNALKEEWQPDWSQAPDDAIGWMSFDGVSNWLGKDGYLIEDAPSFGFTGSCVVERPE